MMFFQSKLSTDPLIICLFFTYSSSLGRTWPEVFLWGRWDVYVRIASTEKDHLVHTLLVQGNQDKLIPLYRFLGC